MFDSDELVNRLLAPSNQFLFDPKTADVGWSLLKDAAGEIKRLKLCLNEWRASYASVLPLIPDTVRAQMLDVLRKGE